jgi:hypothetical protein
MAEEKEQKVTDIRTALADIQKRSLERKKAREAVQKKISDNRAARSKERKSSSGSKLFGLASFSSTTSK